MSNFINFLTAGILAAAPLLFGLLGELLFQKIIRIPEYRGIVSCQRN